MKATVDQLLERVKEIAPIIRQHSAESEQARSLARPIVDAMQQAGLFKMARPKAFGGFELDPVSTFRVVEEVSRLDSAAGWNLNLSVALDYFLAWLPDTQAEDILATPELILGGAFFPPGQAVPVEGGYRVTGRWRFVSGCQHAKWFFFAPLLMDGDTPQLDGQGNPKQLVVFVPAAETKILDTWHTLGMRGTGSHDITAEDVFVAARHSTALLPMEHPGAAFEGPLYRLTIWVAIALLAPPALGVARAAIEDLSELARSKTPSFTGSALRDRQVVQRQVAEAEAHLGAGRAYRYETFEDAWRAALAGEAMDLNRKLKIQLATTHAVACAARAVDLVHAAAGSSAIRNELSFQRYFRDVHTISQHAAASAQRYESVGAVMLGAQSDWGFFSL